MDYLKLLFKYEWNVKSPAGAWQWHPIDCQKMIWY